MCIRDSGGTAAILAEALGLTAGSFCLDAACASALSARGLEVIFWTPSFDINSTNDPQEYPDQSDALTQVLLDASALFVVSPYYLYNEREAAVVGNVGGGRHSAQRRVERAETAPLGDHHPSPCQGGQQEGDADADAHLHERKHSVSEGCSAAWPSHSSSC